MSSFIARQPHAGYGVGPWLSLA